MQRQAAGRDDEGVVSAVARLWALEVRGAGPKPPAAATAAAAARSRGAVSFIMCSRADYTNKMDLHDYIACQRVLVVCSPAAAAAAAAAPGGKEVQCNAQLVRTP